MQNKKIKGSIFDNLKKIENFEEKYQGTGERVRLSIEVYNARQLLRLSQQDLAKEIKTSQKVISNIENADVNIGMDLLGRIIKRLQFTSDHLSRIFECPMTITNIFSIPTNNYKIIEPDYTSVDSFRDNSIAYSFNNSDSDI